MNIEYLSQIDPDRFTAEDVMRLLGCWRWSAKLILGTGVRRGEFIRVGDNYALVDRKQDV